MTDTVYHLSLPFFTHRPRKFSYRLYDQSLSDICAKKQIARKLITLFRIYLEANAERERQGRQNHQPGEHHENGRTKTLAPLPSHL